MATAKSTAGSPSGNPLLAYWDTFAGLVPVKVLSVSTNGNANTSRLTANDAFIRIKIMANRGPYTRGEEHVTYLFHVWSRGHVRRSRRGPAYVNVQPHDWRELLAGEC